MAARKTITKQTLEDCERMFLILKNNGSEHSLEDRAMMVRYLEKVTKPSHNQLKKNGKRSIKKRIAGFRDKRHFFEYVEKWLDNQKAILAK